MIPANYTLSLSNRNRTSNGRTTMNAVWWRIKSTLGYQNHTGNCMILAIYTLDLLQNGECVRLTVRHAMHEEWCQK